MRIGILGTGMVGRALAEGFTRTGHDVRIGTRDVADTRARQADGFSFGDWLAEHPTIELVTFADAAAHAEVAVNATNGSGAIEALTAAGAESLAGKVLIDVSNPLDFSAGFPPTLTVKDTDSLAETIQRTFPEVRVVKSLNTLTAPLMTRPDLLPERTTVFVASDDADATGTVVALLREFGWADVLDLGDLSSARGTEMWLPLWLRIMGSLGGPMFNLRIVR